MSRPNVVLIVADDLGYSDIGCYGGEIRTPRLDQIARAGVRFSQFYNTARCSPSRASLLTGLHPHQTGIGILTDNDGPGGYPGSLNDSCVTIAEVLQAHGYATGLSGKWHLSSSLREPSDSWPTRRGFGHFFGTISGSGSYYEPVTLYRGEEDASGETQDPAFFYTDAIAQDAAAFIRRQAAAGTPFFSYVAFTAPHWPLHAPEDDIDSYEGVYDAGWDELRNLRLERLRAEGLLGPESQLSGRDPSQPPWRDAVNQKWEARRMQAYAAQVDRMDRGIGVILDEIAARGVSENTVVIFLSDNGGCAETLPMGDIEAFRKRLSVPRKARDGRPLRIGNEPDIVPGPEDTFASYGRAWANLSNTPFRFYKRWVHEGGISTPLILHWPAGGLAEADIVRVPFQLTDIVPTLLDITGAAYPPQPGGRTPLPLEGRSVLPALRGQDMAPAALFWEHIGNAAVRRDPWKLVREYPGEWELYDIRSDRSEQEDLSAEYPEIVAELSAEYEAWARRVGVIPREQIIEILDRQAQQGISISGR